MPIIKSFSPRLNLESYKTFITDTDPKSFYFKVDEFKDVFTGGKNGFLIEGTKFLKESTELQIEILDVNGTPVYHEPGDGVPEYYEGLSKVVSVHIYGDTPIGEATIRIFGELKTYVDESGDTVEVPDEWKGIYNIKWEKTFKINRNLANEDKVRFYRRPEIDITELSGSLFNRRFETSIDSGSIRGIPVQPEEGTTLNKFPGSVFYKLRKTDGIFPTPISPRNTSITVSGVGINNQPVDSFINDKELIIRQPYVINGKVASFDATNYELAYETVEVTNESSVLASFAQFDMQQLRTFVGDVARVKILSKPALSISDYELIEDMLLESKEYLQVVESGSIVPIGLFTQDWQNYWSTTGNYTVTQTNENVLGGLKIEGGLSETVPQKISLDKKVRLFENGEYTLEFDMKFTGDITPKELVYVYLETDRDSGSTVKTDIVKFKPTSILKNVQTIARNVKIKETGEYTLIFEIAGERWDFGKVSFKSSQETSFSPDDISFTVPIRRELEIETFDFKFEFYDINNNYIPVNIFKTQTFSAGNVQSIDKSLQINFNPNPFFAFDAEDLPTPENQLKTITILKNKIFGDLLINREVYDITGSIIPEGKYTGSSFDYPGELIEQTNTSNREVYTLPIANFTGSYHENPITDYRNIVGSIVYSVQEDPTQTDFPVESVFTIYRQDVGDSAKQLKVSADKNQFTYKRTDLRPYPANQTIQIELTKENLPVGNETTSSTDPSGREFTAVSPPTPTETYILTAGTGNNTYQALDGTTRYTFSVNDVRGIPYTDSVKIDPVIIDDAVNVKLTKETHTFNSKSTGVLIDNVVDGNVNLSVTVSDDSIQYNTSPTQLPNSWEITGYTLINGNGGGASSTLLPIPPNQSGTTATVGLSSFPASQTEAVINLEITYKDGAGKIEVVNRSINYSKAKIAAPILTPFISPRNQTVNSFSTGIQKPSSNLSIVEVRVQEIYEGSSQFATISNINLVSSSISPVSISGEGTDTVLINLTGSVIDGGVDFSKIDLDIQVQDTENVVRNITDNLSLSKTKDAKPLIALRADPSTQSVRANDNFSDVDTPREIEIKVTEGGSLYSSIPFASTLQPNQFKVNTNVEGGTLVTDTIIQPDTPSTNLGITGSALVNYMNSEGVEFTNESVIFNVSVSKEAKPTTIYYGEPISQTVESNSNLTSVNTPNPITVFVNEGGANYTGVSFGTTLTSNTFKILSSSGTVGGATTNTTVQPTTPTIVTGKQVNGNISIQWMNSIGETDTGGIEFSVSAATAGVPSVTAQLSSYSQTVNQSNTSVIESPQSFTVTVKEGETTYTIGTGNSQFQIGSITGASVVGDTIYPADVGASGITLTIPITYKDSEGNSNSTSLIHTIKVSTDGGDGADGSDGVTVNIVPATSQVVYDPIDETYSTPSIFSLKVFDKSGTFIYQSTLADNRRFRIVNITNGTNNNNGSVTPSTPTGFSPITISFDVEYKTTDGTTVTISGLEHILYIVLDGNTGPGVVFTGEYDNARTYQFTTGAGARRDAVLYNERYYATLQQTQGNLPTNTTYWQDLGTEDFFVAAKIAIFDESFVRNTINIGNNATTAPATANITLYGGDPISGSNGVSGPFFSLGQDPVQGIYGNEGIFIGKVDTDYKMSLAGASGSLLWTGQNLEISGSIIATDGELGNLTVVNNISLPTKSTPSVVIGPDANFGIPDFPQGTPTTNTIITTVHEVNSGTAGSTYSTETTSIDLSAYQNSIIIVKINSVTVTSGTTNTAQGWTFSIDDTEFATSGEPTNISHGVISFIPIQNNYTLKFGISHGDPSVVGATAADFSYTVQQVEQHVLLNQNGLFVKLGTGELLSLASVLGGSTGGTGTSIPNNSTITISAGTNLSDGGNFSLNQSSNQTITLNIDSTKSTNWDSGYNHVSTTNNPHSVTTTQIGAVPTGRILTINGVGYDLSANRSWSVSSGVTSIGTGTGLTGGTITTSGTISLTGQALTLHNFNSNGILTRTSSNAFSARTIIGEAGVTVSNGNGVSGNPSIAIGQSVGTTDSPTFSIPTVTKLDIVPAEGNGIRLWSNESYKISMGTGTDYKYGPVTDYSIKNSMDGTVGRGWTWGKAGLVPVAAIGTNGVIQTTGNNIAPNHISPSDKRVKTIHKEGSGLKLLENVKLYNFTKRGSEYKEWGIIAQELEQNDPDLVSSIKDEEFGEILTVSGLSLAGVAAVSVNELHMKLKEEQEKVKQLEERIKKLEERIK